MTYYCARCASQNGLRPEPPSTDFLATQYQREKHRKHTMPASSHPVQSVFVTIRVKITTGTRCLRLIGEAQ